MSTRKAALKVFVASCVLFSTFTHASNYTPPSANLRMHVDAASVTGAVSQAWLDLPGSLNEWANRSPTPSVDGKFPFDLSAPNGIKPSLVYGGAMNGSGPVVRFDGGEGSVALGLPSDTYNVNWGNSWVLLSVARVDPASAYNAQIADISGDGFRLGRHEAKDEYFFKAAGQKISGGSIGDWDVLRASYDATTQIMELYENGVLVASRSGVSPKSAVTSRFAVGAHKDATGNLLAGDIAEVLVYAAEDAVALEAGEAEAVEAYLMTKWGTPHADAPAWSAEPVSLNAVVHQPIDGPVLSDFVSDANGDLLNFECVAFATNPGRPWLSLDADGSLSGTPEVGDEGTHYYRILAKDGTGHQTYGHLRVSVGYASIESGLSGAANVSLWLDARDVDGDGVCGNEAPGALSRWVDKSGHGNDFSQAIVEKRPELRYDADAQRYAIQFDGSAALQSIQARDWGSDWVILLKLKADTSGGGLAKIMDADPTVDPMSLAVDTLNERYVYSAPTGTYTDVAANNEWDVIVIVNQSPWRGGKVAFYKNGQLMFERLANDVSAAGPRKLTIGSSHDMLSEFMTGEIAQLIVWSGYMDGAQRDALSATLMRLEALPGSTNAYTLWKYANFSNPEAALTGKLEDFDADGLSNFHEFIYGMDPEDPTDATPESGLQVRTTAGNVPEVSLSYRNDGSLQYQLGWTNDLTVGFTQSELLHSPHWRLVQSLNDGDYTTATYEGVADMGTESVQFVQVSAAPVPGPSKSADPSPKQLAQGWVGQMPRFPQPYIMRDWAQVARDYYTVVMDAATNLGGYATIVGIPPEPANIAKPIQSQFLETAAGNPGWDAVYYNNKTFTAPAVLIREEATLEYNWGAGSPDPLVNENQFSGVWTSTLTPELTRDYTFFVQSDDGMAMQIDGVALVDNLGGTYKGSFSILLNAGQEYVLQVQLKEQSGNAKISVKWDYDPSDVEPMVDMKMPTYLSSPPGDEAFTCMSAVIGAELMGQDLRDLAGFDYIESTKDWFREDQGLWHHGSNHNNDKYLSNIYGYFASLYGMLLADLYPEDPDFTAYAQQSARNFLTIAQEMGCPENPDFANNGFHFGTMTPILPGGSTWYEGNVGTVAWNLLVGYELTGQQEYYDCAVASMQWWLNNPERYEGTHMPGPVVAARLNAEYGAAIDIEKIVAIWFGDHPMADWKISSGWHEDGIDCDGLDAAALNLEKRRFYAFTMGSLQGPSWIMPTVRYDQRFARTLARYGLNAANSSRLLQGYSLDWNHQEHKDWKDAWDPDNLLFYEALGSNEPSEAKSFRPYAKGDPIQYGWIHPPAVTNDVYLEKKTSDWPIGSGNATGFSHGCDSLAMYMGNHVGFLGAIVEKTNVDGILRWDCLKTDWFKDAAYPTYLYWNPHYTEQIVTVPVDRTVDIYDSVRGAFIASSQSSDYSLTLAPNQVAVLVFTPAGGVRSTDGNKFMVDDVVVDYRKGL